MDVTMVVVGAIGAAIVIASSAVAGLRLERWARRYVPWVPADVGAFSGGAIGIAVVLTWLI